MEKISCLGIQKIAAIDGIKMPPGRNRIALDHTGLGF